MAHSHRPYQSRLFNFINRQSLQWRDRLGVTFRQLKIAAEWSVQALVAPLYWLMHPREWLDPQLGPPTTSVALPYLSDPPVDQPLQEIFTTIEPWLGLTPSATEPAALPSPQIVLPGHFFETIRQQLADTTLSPGEVPPPLALPASPLARLGQHLKQSWGQGLTSPIIIHGLACQYRSRQLVLVTTDNEVLDVLSPSQQQTVTNAIRRILANFYYQRRVQWALAQKSVGILPLTSAQGTAPLPPLDWLWQGLRWWQGQTLSLSSRSSALAPIPKPSIPSPPLPLVQPVPTNLSMAWPDPPALAQQLQSQWQGLTRQTQQWLTATSPALTPTEVDPFQIRVILQAAIDYFFGPGQRPPALTPTSSISAEPWLAWDDLFVESSSPVLLLETSGTLTKTFSSPSDLASPPSVSPVKPTANPPRPSLEWGQLPDLWAEAVPATPELPAAPAVLAWRNPWQTELETAFDWIETEVRPVGYQRHFLEYLLAGLDQLVFWLEVAVQKLGEWLRGTFWPWLKAVIDEGRRA